MPLYIDLSNLVIPKVEVKKYYNGGLEAFRERFFWENCKNQEDNELFGIAAMNPDELPIEVLKENGMQAIFDEGNYEIVHKYGAQSSVEWLEVYTPFMWHKKCDVAQIKKALIITAMTMEEIAKEAEKGNYLLKTIK